MINCLRPRILPLFTLGAGGLGFALRLWLFANTDEKGLLPDAHISAVLLYILTGLVLAVLFICVRQLKPVSKYAKLFPASIHRSVGCGIGAFGILYTAVFQYGFSGDILHTLTAVVGVAAALAMGTMAFLRYLGSRPSVPLYTVLTAFLMLDTVSRCRVWSAEPQAQMYFFPLLAGVTLMLAGYYLTELSVRRGDSRRFVFFNQAAVFFCCVCMNGENGLFYPAMAAWLALDLCAVDTGAVSAVQDAGEA